MSTLAVSNKIKIFHEIQTTMTVRMYDCKRKTKEIFRRQLTVMILKTLLLKSLSQDLADQKANLLKVFYDFMF